MGIEIERKFLVRGEGWKVPELGKLYRQGYISTAREHTVRVRIVGETGYLTIKGTSVGASRMEFEYEIPLEDAAEMLEELCRKPIIEKTRYTIEYGGNTWEVDEFFGDNQGLIVAEIELESEGQVYEKPPWAGEEVTGDPRYYNANLISRPFSSWEEGE